MPLDLQYVFIRLTVKNQRFQEIKSQYYSNANKLFLLGKTLLKNVNVEQQM